MLFGGDVVRQVACPHCKALLQIGSAGISVACGTTPRPRKTAPVDAPPLPPTGAHEAPRRRAPLIAVSLVSIAVAAAGTLLGVWLRLSTWHRAEESAAKPSVGDSASDGLRSVFEQEDHDAAASAQQETVPMAVRSATTFQEKVAAIRAAGQGVGDARERPDVGQTNTPLTPSLATAVERVRHAVVTVAADAEGMEGIGSGFILQRRRWLVTNHHVVAGCSQATAMRKRDAGSKWIEVGVEGFVACDPRVDLVILALSQDWPEEPLTLATGKPRLGEDVFAIGTPEGLPETVTRGIVSQVRSAADLQSKLAPATPIIQTDAFFTFGSSGGPLCAANGKVMGINTFGCKTDSGSVFRFAVSAEALAPLIQKASGPPRPLAELPAAREH